MFTKTVNKAIKVNTVKNAATCLIVGMLSKIQNNIHDVLRPGTLG